MSNEDDFDDQPGRPTATPAVRSTLGCLVTILAVGWGIVALYYFGSPRITGAVHRMNTSSKLKQMSLAFHIHHDSVGVMPANSYDADGKPLLSWRVHILPYIEEDNLYRRFRLDEPWDGPNNRQLLNEMPRMYASAVTDRGVRGTRTFFRGFATRGAVMEPRPAKIVNGGHWLHWRPDGLTLKDFADGTSNTILIAEAGDSVEWTKPDDLTWDGTPPLPPFGGDRDTAEFQIALADGSVRSVKKSVPPERLKAAITYNGNETETLD